MTSTELYVKDARVWVPHLQNVWEGAVVLNDYKLGDKEITVRSDSGVIKKLEIKNEQSLPHLRNPAILIGQNDLTALSYLHEPDVLYNLQVRFCERQAIYTYCGIVLVAINPYADLPLYGPDIIRAYRGHSMGELEPHIFAVAEEAYAKLEREKCDLSIIVSGESGAGKTVSAKYAMRYFAAVGGSESETQIERKVLASSPIMEAIGNAKTTRNDNSSRFGKFTKLLFTNEISVMSLTGATMQTYLLEKSRVVFQAQDERNYHIFYQLCAAREQYPELMLDHQNKFHYLRQGDSPNIAKISDLDQFNETINALLTLGFKNQEINDIIQILAGILHLGNILFSTKYKETGDKLEVDHESCDINANDLHLNILCDILKLNINDLMKWLTTRQIESFNENVLIPITNEAAIAARDALAKHIYAKLFEFIVLVINKSLISGRKQNCFIGVLDIYGFETFEINSFEQFCINYANEKLQQQFNQHVFKLEQEEYLKEGIVWTMIDFYDNQPCIDLIESKLGILDLLDEECRMPKGSDESWCGKLVEKCSKYKHFERPRFGNTAFLVKHFSDTVQYETNGFLEKNRDTVSKELVNVLRDSDMKFCRTLLELDDEDHTKAASAQRSNVKVVISASKVAPTINKQHRQTVGSQFRDSLSLLITTLHATTPHYVRCIKPNDDKLAFQWEPPKIVQQLRACGVLETVRISAAGFPSRWTYEDFYDRYRLLCKKVQIVDWNVKATCSNIIKNWIADPDKYRTGNTQIFFRAGQVAYLEQLRADTRRKHIILIQSVVRRFIYRRRFIRIQKSVLGIQRHARGMLARRKAQNLRENRAAITIQRYVKGWLCRSRFQKLRLSILGIQIYARGLLARRRFKIVLDNYRATQVQRFCRGYLARIAFNLKLKRIIKCQAVVRGFLARRLYKRMKAEARTISHIQNKYTGLEKKVMTLQQKLDDLNKENSVLRVKSDEAVELKQKLEIMRPLETEVKLLRITCHQHEEQIEKLKKQVDVERDDKMSLLSEKEQQEKEKENQKAIFVVENEKLKQQIFELEELSSKKEDSMSFRNRILSEVDTNGEQIHQAYQKTIKDKDSLENENQFLRQEINRLSELHKTNKFATHSRSISNASSQNEEDFGYSSAKNTLDNKRTDIITPKADTSSTVTSPSSKGQIGVILRLRKLLEDEKNKNNYLENQIYRLQNKSSVSLTTEDSLKMSELEVENEKLRQDYQLLRNSIKRGVEHQEIEAQYNTLQEELKRRRDECIQLRTILAQQSQSLRSLGSTNLKNVDNVNENGELIEAFQAQKLVNRQLESELTALTEENNAKLEEYNKQIDQLRSERDSLQSILLEKVDESEDDTIEGMRNTQMYLKYELERSTIASAEIMEKHNVLLMKFNELKKKNQILSNRLRDHGLRDSILIEEPQSMAIVKKKQQIYDGMFKYRHEDENKILQRLITELKPRTAITLLPGLPAYILFMCIRYTDLVNTDTHVKTLLTNFVIMVKKFFKHPNTTECRVLWLVNSLTLHNLLIQYGGIEEYIKLNTEVQNQKQLKNFDLSEYRHVLYEKITIFYNELVVQVQDIIKTHIVPAILVHDEMARGRARGRSMSLTTEQNQTTEPKSLVNHLEYYYKQLKLFGLDDSYIEQIFKQLIYYICAVALNNLMLRPELCMWVTGMKIRYNISCLESWVREMKMSSEVLSPLLPLIQATSLLQSRKSEEDVQTIYELCSALSTSQVLRIIKSYILDDCELPIKPAFIDKLTKILNERSNKPPNTEGFMMEENLVYPIKVMYKHSDIKLEEIEIPEILNLEKLLIKI